MKVYELDINKYLDSLSWDPTPRFSSDELPGSERGAPNYLCEKCSYTLSFSVRDFEKHWKSMFSNLSFEDFDLINKYRRSHNLIEEIYVSKSMKFGKRENHISLSFLDFYCPKCKQPTAIIFRGYPSGYWGYFSFTILRLLVLK